jgi:hypothetical protein
MAFSGGIAVVPTMAKPEVSLAGDPLIRWAHVKLAGSAVESYLVTRHDGGKTKVVCTVPATDTSCLDSKAPTKGPLSYTVRAKFGKWEGADSDTSIPVTVPRNSPKPSAATLAQLMAAPVTPQTADASPSAPTNSVPDAAPTKTGSSSAPAAPQTPVDEGSDETQPPGQAVQEPVTPPAGPVEPAAEEPESGAPAGPAEERGGGKK